MNRSFSNVLFGAFGQLQTTAATSKPGRTVPPARKKRRRSWTRPAPW